jgi:hypothetical protein
MSTLKAENIQSITTGSPIFKTSSGTEAGQLAKAWVNFTGDGTVSINDDFNVSSITDNGQSYVLNFSTAFANANYAATGMVANTNDAYSTDYAGESRGGCTVQVKGTTAPTASALEVETVYHASASSNGGFAELDNVHVVVFGS